MPPTLSPIAREIESHLGKGGNSELFEFLRQETQRQLEGIESGPSKYDIFVVRRNALLGDEIFGPEPLHVGSYSEETLYGAAGSQLSRFRSAIQDLKARAERAGALNTESADYGQHATQIWLDIDGLNQFFGVTPVISQIVAKLRVVRSQFYGKDIPLAAIRAITSGLGLIAEAKRLDTALVDRLIEKLHEGGISPAAPSDLCDTPTGTVKDGVVVLPPDAELAEGTRVLIVPVIAVDRTDPFLQAVAETAKPRPHWPKDYALNHGSYVSGEPRKL